MQPNSVVQHMTDSFCSVAELRTAPPNGLSEIEKRNIGESSSNGWPSLKVGIPIFQGRMSRYKLNIRTSNKSLRSCARTMRDWRADLPAHRRGITTQEGGKIQKEKSLTHSCLTFPRSALIKMKCMSEKIERVFAFGAWSCWVGVDWTGMH